MQWVFLLYKVFMHEVTDEDVADKNILSLFRFLSLLEVVHGNYEWYGLEWGKRQAYIYRILSTIDSSVPPTPARPRKY